MNLSAYYPYFLYNQGVGTGMDFKTSTPCAEMGLISANVHEWFTYDDVKMKKAQNSIIRLYLTDETHDLDSSIPMGPF